jgi:hypothetical protein
MADSSLEEVFFDGVLHEVVVDGAAGALFVVADGDGVVGGEGGEVGDFEVEFIRQSSITKC